MGLINLILAGYAIVHTISYVYNGTNIL